MCLNSEMYTEALSTKLDCDTLTSSQHSLCCICKFTTSFHLEVNVCFVIKNSCAPVCLFVDVTAFRSLCSARPVATAITGGSLTGVWLC